MKLNPSKSTLIMAACLSLAACGGSGGGNANDTSSLATAVALSTSNYGTVTAEVVGTVSGISDVSNLVGGVLTGTAVQGKFNITQFLMTHFPAATSRLGQTSQQFTGVTSTETIYCTGGGSIALQVTDVNGNQLPDAGDTVTMNSQNCIESGAVINGALSMTINSFSGDIDALPFSVGMSVTSSNFRATYSGITESITGTMKMLMTVNSPSSMTTDVTSNATTRLTGGGKDETYQMNGYRVVTQLSTSQAKITLDGSINVPSLGANAVTISTTSPFISYNQSTPTQGQALISAANGGQIRVTANSTANALIEFDAGGDGTYETSKTESWNNLF